MIAVVNDVDKKEQRVKNVFRVIIGMETAKGYMSQAQVYAHAGLRMEGDDLIMQIPRILNNLHYWRGDEARRCKKVLKKFGGVR